MSSWSRCSPSDLVTIPFGSHGARITVQRRAVPAFMTLAAVMESHGYFIRPADTGAYNCRYIAGTTTWSNHSTGTAVDVNWQSNPRASHLITDMPPAMIRAIEAIETVDGIQVFRWGGRYSNSPDAMHFEVMVTPEQLARGIKGIPGGLFMPGEVEELIKVIQAQGELTRKAIRSTAEQTQKVVKAQGELTRQKIAALD